MPMVVDKRTGKMRKKKRMTSKQKMALKKAQRKANTGQAKLKRAKSRKRSLRTGKNKHGVSLKLLRSKKAA